jgi:hypothetical protein
MARSGLDPLEEDIVRAAYAMVEAQTMVGRIGRVHGLIKGKSSKRSPLHYLKEEAFNELGHTKKALEEWEEKVKEQKAKLIEAVTQHPLWQDWAQYVKGLGPLMTGLVMAGIGDVTRVDNSSGLWKSFGLDLDEKGRARRLVRGIARPRGFPFARLVLGRLRVTIMKTGAKSGGFYYDIYETARLRYDKLHPDWPEGKRFGAAIRYFEKIFLAHFWEVWREKKGLEAPPPYILMREGDPHRKIEPEQAMEKKPRRKAKSRLTGETI